MSDIAGLRIPYNTKSNLLLENMIVKDPFAIFEDWFSLAKNNPAVIEPNAMCLATATKDGIPSARFVLCKGYGKDGFKFFTHYTSRKGSELAENPNAALTFYWAALHRSIRIEGSVEKLPMIEAENYFNVRPYDSQIGAAISDQSKPIESRQVLIDKEQELKSKYKEGEVPKPPLWGGYVLKPKSIEFWQGQDDRIHDRIKFSRTKCGDCEEMSHEAVDGWFYTRLAP